MHKLDKSFNENLKETSLNLHSVLVRKKKDGGYRIRRKIIKRKCRSELERQKAQKERKKKRTFN